jgi:hypothetical protein
VIAIDPELTKRAVSRFACSDAKSIIPFARQLAISAPNPDVLISHAIQVVEASEREPNRAFFSGLISGADSKDRELARAFVRTALTSPKLKKQAITLIGAGHLQPNDIALVAALLRSGDVEPRQCIALSYGRGLDHMPVADFMPLLEELERHGTDGLWAIIEMISMYLYGGKRPDKALAKFLKRVLINPALLTQVRGDMDGHNLETMIVLIVESGEINAPYAKRLTKQLMSICDDRARRDFYALDDPVRKSLDALMRTYPAEVWAIVSAKVLSKLWRVRFYARNLLQAREESDHLNRAIAFHVPVELILLWVRDNPKERAAVPSRRWLEFEGGVISGLDNKQQPALTRRRRSRHDKR